jgi:hypothetical protein
MKSLWTGIFIGAMIGGVFGTMASDEIYGMKKRMFRAGKRIAKKYDLM